ncbi:Chaperone protein dnaJ [Rhodotorula kratochvilovae]
MVVNRDEALRALAIAQRHLDAGKLDSAIRFAKKSIALEPTLQEARTLLARAETLASSSSAGASDEPAPSASTSATSAGPSSASTSSRAKSKAPEPAPSTAKQYTAEQLAVVKRVKGCRATAYYEILELEKTCSDGQVKKAYRKLALSLHPDKNLAPGAEEAFKMVSKAFQVLSDSNKRAIFDQTGGDPDSRGGGGGGGGGGGFARQSGFSGAQFGGADEVSPEDLFRAFFGGGMGGGGFGGGGPFQTFGGGGSPFGGSSFQFYGPGGTRMHMGGGGPRRAGAQQRPGQQGQQQGSLWLQVAPLLLFFALSLLTQLPSFLSSSSSPADPSFAFEPRAAHDLARDTAAGTRYFVGADEFAQHPLWSETLALNPELGFASAAPPGSAQHKRDLVAHLRRTAAPVVEGAGAEGAAQAAPQQAKVRTPRGLARFESKVDEAWVARLQNLCRMEDTRVRQLNRRNDALERARGFLGIGTDHARIKEVLETKSD